MTALGVWAPAARKVAAVVDGEPVELHRGPDDWWRADREIAHGSDYGFRVDGGDGVLPDPRSRWQPAGVHGPSRAYDDDLFAWTDRGWEGGAARGLDRLRAARRHVHHRRDAGRRDRPAGPPRRPRHRPGRADAGRRVPRQARMGVRRGPPVRRARALRRPGRAEALRRRLPLARPRGPARRGLQPPRAERQLPAGVRSLLHRQAPHALGRGGEPRRRRQRRGASLDRRQRADVAARLPHRRAAARRRARAGRRQRRAPPGPARRRGRGARRRSCGGRCRSSPSPTSTSPRWSRRATAAAWG